MTSSPSARRSSSGCDGICTTSSRTSRSRPQRWIARELIRSIRERTKRTKRIRAFERELDDLVADYAPQLLAEVGCGPLTAAKLIGELAGAEPALALT